MEKPRTPVGKSAETRRFVVGRAGFAKISEVEGVRLSADMKARANEALEQSLTPDAYRVTIVRAHRKD